MRRALALAGAAALTSSLLIVAAPPAAAETCIPGTRICQGGDITHHSPDKGYDAPIQVRCDYGKGPTRVVREGQKSTKVCGNDTDQVFVARGQQISCRYKEPRGVVRWKVTFDRTGWHKIGDLWSKSCVMERD